MKVSAALAALTLVQGALVSVIRLWGRDELGTNTSLI